MAHDARHSLDKPIFDLQTKIDQESDPIEQDKLFDILQTLMDIRAEQLDAMEPKARRMDVWQQRMDDDTWDLY